MSEGQIHLNFAAERRIYKVSELSRRIRERLETEFANVWVEGEISNFRRAPSGHLYFTLKDAAAQMRCVCFKQHARYWKFQPEDGLQVLARGRVSVYEPRGEYQLYVELLEPQGVGALQLAFEQLKQRLAAEGLFDPSRKKPLPKLPRRIGIITSPRGAVIQDMIRILERRHKNLHLLLYPVRVQGEGAAEEMVEALRFFHLPPPSVVPVDVIIVARGGGSLEDLWAFNEEKLARAIAASKIPVISAVGHETDFTIADFVADLRAPTPSAAAELVIETQEQLEQQIATAEEAMRREMRYQLLQRRQELTEWMAHRGFQNMRTMMAQLAQRQDEIGAGLADASRSFLLRNRRRWEGPHGFLQHFDLRGRQERALLHWDRQSTALANQMHLFLVGKRAWMEPLAAKLENLSPRRVLERGYAIVFDEVGNVVRNATEVSSGQQVTAQLAHGRLQTRVEEVIPEEESSV
ncbi:MAG: exodeoxyribonuclease VII large subunit [Acidobacteria bacterium]|nr:exodeoxyribonuclease VII large subunit [Acidobacteriota bacterium]